MSNAIPLSHSQDAGSKDATTSGQEGDSLLSWLHFLSRWALFAGLVFLGLLPAFFVAVVSASQNSPLPPAYLELVAASKNSALYRVAITFDELGWVMLGGFFIAFAALLTRRAPIRSVFLVGCGIGQVAGMIGAFIRLAGTSTLAAHYATAVPAQQALLRQSYLDLVAVFTAHYNAGALLWALALVLVAWGAWSMGVFPRWLLGLMALVGTVELAQQVVQLITGIDSEFLIFPELLLLIVVFSSVAGVGWRRKPTHDAPMQTANQRVQ